MKLAAISLAIGSLFSANLLANELDLSQEGNWSFGADTSFVGLESEQAAKEGIDESAYTLGIEANYSKSNWLTTVSTQILMFDDNNEFRQAVEGSGWLNEGDRDVKSSDASAVIFSVATGRYWQFGEKKDVRVAAQLGFSTVGASERSIANCSDCRSEDIDIDGGAFIKAGVTKDLGAVNIGLQATQYISGDGLKNSLGFTLSTKF